MPIETSTITTYTCSIPGCTTPPRVVAGDDPDKILFNERWLLHEVVLGHAVDLCPIHVDELSNWLTGDDSQQFREDTFDDDGTVTLTNYVDHKGAEWK